MAAESGGASLTTSNGPTHFADFAWPDRARPPDQAGKGAGAKTSRKFPEPISFTNTELAKDGIKHLFHIDGADNLAHCTQSVLQINRDVLG